MPLSGSGAFEAVFERGRRIDGRHLQLIVAEAAAVPGRVGFIFSRKALARAVDRNRLRRQIRAMLVAEGERLAAFDIVVRAKPPMTRATLPAAAGELHVLLDRIR